MLRFFRISLISLLVSCFLAACGTSHAPRFHKTRPDTTIDVSKIPNAVPRHEARSRYGNPKSYVVFGQRYYPMNSARGFVETGVSSWYGPNFHGKKTSSQEIYDMYKMTAAHKTLPIPSYVEVTNLHNGRRIVVRVNDRGPFHDNRIIDLSFVAAKKLDIIKTGTVMVEIQVIDPSNPQAHLNVYEKNHGHQQKKIRQKNVPEQIRERQSPQPVKHKQLYIQLGAFAEIENARKLKNRIQRSVNQTVSIVTVQKQTRSLHKVIIGPMDDIKMADQVSLDLNDAGLYDHKLLFQ